MSGARQFIYFARCGDAVKIGTSRNPEERVRSFNANLLALEEGGYPRERELHRQFSHLWMMGEWFEAADELLTFMAQPERSLGRHTPPEHCREATVPRAQREVMRERLAASRAAQGLPPKLTDPVAVRKLAALFSVPAVPVDACTPPQRPRASAGARGPETRSKKSDERSAS